MKISTDVKYYVVLAFILVFLFAGNHWWYLSGEIRQHWDSSIHLMESIDAFKVVQNGGGVTDYLMFSWYYPPFVSWSSIPIYLFFGVNEYSGYLVITMFLLLLVVSVFLICKKIEGNVAALLSAGMIASAPIVLEYSRSFMLDLPLAAMTALSVYLYLQTEEFDRLRYSILFAVAFSFGMLTKWTFVFPFFIPFIFDFILIIKNKNWRNKRLINFFIFIGIVIGLSFPWYLLHSIQIATSRLGELGRGDLTFIDHCIYYLKIMPDDFGIVSTIVMLIGVISFVRNSGAYNKKLILLFVCGYFFLSIVKFKIPRFGLPLLPLIVVIGSIGFSRFTEQLPARYKRIISLFLCLIFPLQYILVSTVSSNTVLAKKLADFHVITGGATNEQWYQRDIVKSIADDMRQSNALHSVVRVVPDQIYFNRYTLDYYRCLEKLPLTLSGINGLPHFCDYVVIREGENVVHENNDRKLWTERTVGLDSISLPLFYRLKSWKLPDGTNASVYKIKNERVKESDKRIEQKIGALLLQFLGKFIHSTNSTLIKTIPCSSDSFHQGFVNSIRFSTPAAEFGDYSFSKVGIPVNNIDIELKGVRIAPNYLMEKDSLILIHIDEIIVHSLLINTADIRKYVEQTQRGKILLHQLRIDDGKISLQTDIIKSKLSINAEVRITALNSSSASVSIEQLTLNSIPLPSTVLNTLLYAYNPILKCPDIIRSLQIGKISLRHDTLSIGTDN